jgi:hypothetical protein
MPIVPIDEGAGVGNVASGTTTILALGIHALGIHALGIHAGV